MTVGVVGAIVIGLLAVAIYDRFLSTENVTRNYPLIAHGRQLLLYLGPLFRAWVLMPDTTEKPFDRNQREWIKNSAHGTNNHFAFGVDRSLYSLGYPIIKHAGFAIPGDEYSIHKKIHSLPCAKTFGESHKRRLAWRPPSIINISGMSFGSLSGNAIQALNLGAKIANCYHNTGEGGLTPHHRQGGDLIFQFGTGYFGCRDKDGGFSLDRLEATLGPEVKGIEIKLSQGAEPNCGVLLPGKKVTREIAEARGIPRGKDCISPNHHTAFRNIAELIRFVERLAASTGLPVGIKSAVGQISFWRELAQQMRSTGAGPDWITIDGGEGGTGAAPMVFTNHVSLPFRIGFARVYEEFKMEKQADHVAWIGSGKLGLPERAVTALALGADVINVGREAMLSIGCVQSMKCHTNACPTGVTTQNPLRTWALQPKIQAQRYARYCQSMRNEILALTHAAGHQHPSQFTAEDIELSNGQGDFVPLKLSDSMSFRPNNVNSPAPLNRHPN